MWPSVSTTPTKEDIGFSSDVSAESPFSQDGSAGVGGSPESSLLTPSAAASPSPKPAKNMKKKYAADPSLQNYYFDKLSKERMESHVLDDLDTANVNVTDDFDPEEEAKKQ